MRYRRTRDLLFWHSEPSCTGWPTTDYDEVDQDGRAQPRCIVCEAKMINGKTLATPPKPTGTP